MAKRSRGRLARMRSLRMVRRPLRPSWHLALSGVLILTAIIILLFVQWQARSRELPPMLPVAPPAPAADALALADTLYSAVESVLEELGIGADQVRKRRSAGQPDHIFVPVPGDLPLSVVNLELTRFVETRGGQVLSARETAPGRQVEMYCGFGQTGTTLFSLERQPGLRRQTGRIAIVIDDFGARSSDRRLNDWFGALPHRLTFAVLPNEGPVEDILDLAEKGGHEVILHLPMEPNDPKHDPGKGAIRVDHTEEQIRQRLGAALRKVPVAVGVNNHMGSRTTADLRVMEQVLRELKSRGLYFLDSRTSEHSIAFELAGRLQVPALNRDLFIDEMDDPSAIEARLWELAALAGRTGQAIGIGHNRRNTLLALQAVLPRLETRGFLLVSPSTLVQ